MRGMDFNILFLIGFALFSATAAEKLLSKIKVPGVIGCIVIGIFLGESGAGVLDEGALDALAPLNYFALGLIGFVVGGELKKEVIKKYGNSLLKILFFGGAGSFLLVFVMTFSAGYLLLDNTGLAVAVALLLGAISTASDPATQTGIIWETRSRGPLTTNILGMTALSDALAIFFFAIASSVAMGVTGVFSSDHTVLAAGYEILGSVFWGAAAGLLFAKILEKNPGKEMIAGLSFGFILLLVGAAITFGFDMILSLMAFGVLLVNRRPERSKQVFSLAGQAVRPVFALFFVILGASLDLVHFALIPGVLVVFYLAGITIGRFAGIRAGARLSGAPAVVGLRLPYSLFSQAGIAVGLTVLAVQTFPGEIGSMMVAVVTPAVLVLQVVGPVLTKSSLHKAGEAGLNVTEEDILESIRVSELSVQDPVFVHEGTPLPEILKLFSSCDDLYFPVVSEDKKLLGIVSVEGIKYTLLEEELGELLIAFDIMEPAPVTVRADSSLSSVKQVMESYQIDYAPVTDDEGRLVGFIENNTLRKFVSSRLLEFKRRLVSLEC